MPIMLSSSIRKQIMQKKNFLVLDDVNDSNSEQLDLLIGKHDFYGPGSRIIITSRDKHVLRYGCAEIYEMKKLDYHEGLQLLNMHAFGQNPQTKVHMKLAVQLVKYAQGIPLALKALGSNLYNKSIEEWEDELEKLKNIPNQKIHKILRISYDELEENEKEIFLDIACFFKSEDINHIESILYSCGFFAKIGISRLLDKSLVTISKNKLCMHDLLRQMGNDIVREECIKNPGKCSRLWIPGDVFHVLMKGLKCESSYNEGVLTYENGYCIADGEVPQRMRYQNNSGSSLSISLNPDPHDFMIIAFFAVVDLNNYCCRNMEFLKCKCSFAAKSGRSFKFETFYGNIQFDFQCQVKSSVIVTPNNLLQSEHGFLWCSIISFKSNNIFSEASFDFFIEDEGATRSSGNSRKSCRVNVIKCGVHVLFDDNDIDFSSLEDGDTTTCRGCGFYTFQ